MAGSAGETGWTAARIKPALDAETYVFCTTNDPERLAAAEAAALGWLREDEGISLILERSAAGALGLTADLPMRRIVLTVQSALDDVGLTAAVSGALAAANIPCNVVAGLRHDHLFVPAATAERALEVLGGLGGEGTSGEPRRSN